MHERGLRGALVLTICLCICGMACLLVCGYGRDVTGATYFVRTAADGTDTRAHGRVYVDGRQVAEADFTEEWSYEIE